MVKINSWEASRMSLKVDFDQISTQVTPENLTSAKIFFHYYRNQGFLKEGQLINNVNKIRHIPAVIIHGRYDAVCPVITAWDLHQAWPEADFHIIPEAGHHGSEPGITDKIIEYTDKFAEL